MATSRFWEVGSAVRREVSCVMVLPKDNVYIIVDLHVSWYIRIYVHNIYLSIHPSIHLSSYLPVYVYLYIVYFWYSTVLFYDIMVWWIHPGATWYPLDAAGSLPTLRLSARTSPWFKARDWAPSQPMAWWRAFQYVYIYIHTCTHMIWGDIWYLGT